MQGFSMNPYNEEAQEMPARDFPSILTVHIHSNYHSFEPAADIDEHLRTSCKAATVHSSNFLLIDKSFK